jgi:predicted kinase
MADNLDLLDMLNLTWLDVTAITFVIENHLPYDLKLEKQTKLRTAVNAYLGADEKVFTDVLLADTHGRNSDDEATKRANTFAWVFGFMQIPPNPVRKPHDAPSVIVLIGASGSGKSTWMKKYTDTYPNDNVNVFSLDMERLRFFYANHPTYAELDEVKTYRLAFQYANDNSAAFTKFADKSFVEMLATENTLIIDNVNASRKARRKWLTVADQKGFKTWAVMFPMSLSLLAGRSATRTDKKVPSDAVTRQFMSVSVPWAGSEVNSVSVIAPN